MKQTAAAVPPRAIAAGDIVTKYSDVLGEWTVAQVTHLDPGEKSAAVLMLDWSGSEPTSVSDVDGAPPLADTSPSGSSYHHVWNDWVLPRSCRVIGSLPRLVDEPATAYGSGWRLGDDLFFERRRAAGGRSEPWSDPTELSLRAGDLGSAPQPTITKIELTEIRELDCGTFTRQFPNLTELGLFGTFGTLTNAEQLNRLSGLRRVLIRDLFGMSRQDILRPGDLPELEWLTLYGTPAEYASATRDAWRPEVPSGVLLEVLAPRKPDWIEQNRENPLRDWHGRAGISAARYKRATAQLDATRGSIRGALTSQTGDVLSERLTEIGREFAIAFNRMDARSPFIKTVEREELYAALEAIMSSESARRGRDLAVERLALLDGVDAVREW